MENPSSVGQVPSLFPHVARNWWEEVFDEFYLRTDGDVVEDAKITEKECQEILALPQIANIFDGGANAGKDREVRVLDLCCGQGRHSIWLAKQYPNISFHGHDSSSYLIDIARMRAADIANVSFTEGNANKLPPDQVFDLVLVMGNSFGYSDTPSDANMVKEVVRVLKPGGFFVLDLPDALWMQSGIKERSWEWIDGRDSEDLVGLKAGPSGTAASRHLLACRERELDTIQKRLASREIIIDLETGVVKDNFYASRIYELDEALQLLQSCGLAAVSPENLPRPSRPNSQRDEDLGMMEQRHLLVAQKPDFGGPHDKVDEAVEFYMHPSLCVGFIATKGRCVLAKDRVAAGTLILVDTPYATVPSVDPVRGDYLICSKHGCGRRWARSATPEASVVCGCIEDVVWCDKRCHELDQERHALECAWLKEFAETVLSEHGTYDFNMLWVVVRVLCQRRLRHHNVSEKDIDVLLSNEDRFPPETVRHWHRLAELYLQGDRTAEGLTVPDLVHIICKEETNSFCLYLGATGIYPSCEPHQSRGIPYGLSLAARAAVINHSCLPNVSNLP